MSFASSSVPAEDRQLEQFQQLLAQVRAGDENAAWQLVEHYGRTILRTVRGMLDQPVRRRFDSLDFTQSVWLSFFRHRSEIVEFRHPNQLVQFLANTACHKVFDVLRRLSADKRDIKKEIVDQDAAGALLTSDPTPSQFAAAREQWEGMLARQPEKYRDVLHMRFLGHTQASIADTLHIDETTVRRILRQAEHEYSNGRSL